MSGIRDGVIQFFRSKNFCLTVPKIFVGEPFCAVFQKISGIEKFYRKEGGGKFRIFRRKLLSHRAEIFLRGTLLSFTKLPVSKNFRDKRGGGVTIRRRKGFCLIVLKNFVGDPFDFSLNSGNEKC